MSWQLQAFLTYACSKFFSWHVAIWNNMKSARHYHHEFLPCFPVSPFALLWKTLLPTITWITLPKNTYRSQGWTCFFQYLILSLNKYQGSLPWFSVDTEKWYLLSDSGRHLLPYTDSLFFLCVCVLYFAQPVSQACALMLYPSRSSFGQISCSVHHRWNRKEAGFSHWQISRWMKGHGS